MKPRANTFIKINFTRQKIIWFRLCLCKNVFFDGKKLKGFGEEMNLL